MSEKESTSILSKIFIGTLILSCVSLGYYSYMCTQENQMLRKTMMHVDRPKKKVRHNENLNEIYPIYTYQIPEVEEEEGDEENEEEDETEVESQCSLECAMKDEKNK